MRPAPLCLALTATAVVLGACGDNRPNAPAEMSPAVSEPAAGVPAQASPEAAPGKTLQGRGDDWRSLVAAQDAGRLGRLDQAWRMARAEAEEGGFARQVEALGPLVDPNAAQPGRVQPAPGDYRCRTLKLGRASDADGGTQGGGLAYVDYPWFACTVALTPGGDLILTKTTGSQRTRGLLYPDTDRRMIYVGAQALSEAETRFPAYGEQADRDQVGVLERVGQNRWRLVIPWPRQEAKLELLEIEP